MNLSHEQCYQAIKTQDARFDGVFFTAVKTTGIYCRPICKVPAPKSENCIFYDNPVEAEKNGFRPCLRCRPELAPEYNEFAQGSELIEDILNYFETGNYRPKIIGEASDYFGVSTRHILRLFQQHLGVSPKDFIMTKRLLNAKSLLVDTTLKIADIAEIVGFGSVSRFNFAFKEHYQLTPTLLRKNKRKTQDYMEVKLSYRPPYNWAVMLQFLKMRLIPGVEHVTEDNIYRRSIRLVKEESNYSGWLEVKPDIAKNLVIVKVSKSLEKVLLDVIKVIRKAFDLDASPELMNSNLPKGIRLPGCFDAFEMGTRAILGQQITVKAAHTLATRIVEKLGVEMSSPWDEVRYHFPSAEEVCQINSLNEVLGPLGVIKSRSHSISELSKAIASGYITFDTHHPEEEKNKLLSLKGIGPWTAEYLAMRGMSWPDAFPVSDIGIKHGLADKLMDAEGHLVLENSKGLSKYVLNKVYEKHALEYAENFRPWRSYLTISLWYSLSVER